MKEVSDVVACVVDTSGYFLPLARQLGQTYKRVLFHNPNWQKGSPVLNDGVIGDGFPDIEWCEDFWPIKDEIDLFIFPDLQRAGTQQELRDQGFAVWGAAGAMKLETNRQFFMKKLAELGLDMPDWYEVVGVTALGDFLKDQEDIWIKLSKWRGSWETYHWRSQNQDGHRLHYWHVKYGPFAEKLRFLCFPKINTKLEIGADTYCIDGQWPETLLVGLENKDSAYWACVKERKEAPTELVEIMDAFSPFLKETQCRSQWSMEVRITDDAAYFIDATVRGGLPSTASQLINMENLPQVLYYGAMGQLIQPDYKHPYTAECMVRLTKPISGCWETLCFDKELEPHLMLSDCCLIDNQVWFPSDDEPTEELGWMACSAETPTALAKEVNRLADLLPDGCDAAVESLSEVIREAIEMESKGMPFAEHAMPDPSVVLEES